MKKTYHSPRLYSKKKLLEAVCRPLFTVGRIKTIVVVSAFLPLTIFSACSKSNKSELVNRLESIFYSQSFASIPERIFNTADFGAIGDGKTLATEAIQKTIDAAATAGGGRVVFSAGTYLSGALFVKSNVELRLDEDVIIQAIQDDKQYPDIWTRIAGIEMEWPAALINVYQQKNARITGKGIIDGNGKYWWDKFWGDPPRSGGMWTDYEQRDVRWAVDYDCKRVRPVAVYESEEVLLKDFTVKRAGFWTISLTYSSRVYVDGLVIRNNIGGFGPSSDGINTDSSKDVLVENCDIDCNDDNLCIKAGRDADGLRVNRPAENIVYRNCIARSGHGLFTIGSETSGGMRNIEVYGLEAMGTNTGIRFKSAKVRGGVVEKIWFHDIKMKDVDHPFHFELNWYPAFSYPKIPDEIPADEIPERWKTLTQAVLPPERGIPEFKDISLSDIAVEGAAEAFYVNAYPEKPIRGLNWKNISVEAQKSGSVNHAADWKMENVILKTQTGQNIELKNSTNIELPDFFPQETNKMDASPKKQSMEEQIKDIIAKNEGPTIIPFNPEEENIIFEGDSTEFSENLSVYLFPENDAQITWFEPLGDGFYFSPVSILVASAGNEIKVSGEKNHNWIFSIKSETRPQIVNGADQWRYDAEKKYVVVEKAAAKFQLTISF